MANNKAIIYAPAKTAMQSGKGKTGKWLLEYIPANKKIVDNLMGWQGSNDMLSGEIKIFFDDKNEAISYANKHKIEFEIVEPKQPKLKIQAYAENFTG
ncbi:MAG: ETC complex I subunit [Rickettsiales bacterium]|nr:ETC complex I subunit [Rickettsiales bacterium]